jgi:hypothetical protein
MLVNLPKRLIFLNEERIRAFRSTRPCLISHQRLTSTVPDHLPRDQITFLFQKGTQEYDFFKLLWRHTNDVNIQLAASAITQAKVLGPTCSHPAKLILTISISGDRKDLGRYPQ